ncbi:MAG TPA: transketolase [Blastocatellia bacterium]|nr:transketolase [Blastocatellia bacterium]
MDQVALDKLAINTIRTLSMDAVQKANSGHPGMPMGMAPAAYVLWTRMMRYNPKNPRWANRDRFVLSAGHGSMLLYSMLYLTGYDDFTLDQLKNFRQWGSLTPGHPESELSPAVETTTGPLGQGFANGVGFAIGAEYLAATFNRPGHELFDYHIYAIVSDGDLMEGVASEAASLAGHLKLGRLIYLYDDNDISLDGGTAMSFTEDRAKRFEAYGWHVQSVDGLDTGAIEKAIRAAQQDPRPSIICTKTIIGYGSPNKQGTHKAHGEPLGVDEVKLAKQNFGWPYEEPFTVPEESLALFRKAIERGAQLEASWNSKVAAYEKEHPDLGAQWKSWASGKLPEGWQEKLPVFEAGKDVATRDASGKVLNALAPVLPMLIGGAADLRTSNKTFLNGYPEFSAEVRNGRNLNFGVREHAMGATMNGLALTVPLIPYGGTFLVFSQYMLPPVRLAAMMGLRTIYVWTHDSIGVGEDGPTHQPVEHLPALRAIPNLTVIRPGDANETAVAWRAALENTHGPTALALTRQGLPTFDRAKFASAEGLLKGAYVLADAEGGQIDVILIATGSEVSVAMAAREKLAAEGIRARVVSLPSWELFEKQPQEYKDSVLPPGVTARLGIEAAVGFGWERYVGPQGGLVVMQGFGASAPIKVVMEKFGFTADNVAAKAKALLGK